MTQAAQDLNRWRVEHHSRVDLRAAEAAAADLLTALGIDLADESTAETPGRMARALAEMLSPTDFEMTTFPNDEQYDEHERDKDLARAQALEDGRSRHPVSLRSRG